MTHLHIDATIGAAGDMLLAALIDAGARVDLSGLAGARLEHTRGSNGGVTGVRARIVAGAGEAPHRAWRDIRGLVAPWPVALGAFERLAQVEAAIHGVAVDDVHFHEVGAVDSIGDLVGIALALQDLQVGSVSCSRVGVGSGTVRTAHGVLPVPAPATALLLRGAPTWGGPLPAEACTPTAAALLAQVVQEWGPQPAMTVTAVGTGLGTYEGPTPNITRVFVGAREDGGPGEPWLLETNIDDLDPRLWPHVLQELLEVGASDAWLTPILMKKGRPAHTLSVLVAADRLERVRSTVVAETSTIGLRQQQVGKWALQRRMASVDVLGQAVAVKLAVDDAGLVVNVQPEWEDVRRAAAALGRPAHEVLQRATAAAQELRDQNGA
jgi:uncharacterized protein (TIGR00299 family) protein